jgi:hypothetical protein
VIHDELPFGDYLVGEAGIALTLANLGNACGCDWLAGIVSALAGLTSIIAELATRLRD